MPFLIYCARSMSVISSASGLNLKAAKDAPAPGGPTTPTAGVRMSSTKRLSAVFSSNPLANLEDEKKKKEKEKNKDLDKKLFGPGGKELLRQMAPKEIDRKFKQLLGQMGVKDASSMKEKYTTEQKITLIEAVIAQHQETSDTPESFVNQLRNFQSIQIDTLEKLAEKLEDSEWVSQFLGLDGTVALMEVVLFCLFKARYESPRLFSYYAFNAFNSYLLYSSLTGSDTDDVPRLEKLLTCITTMVNTGV